MDKRTMICVLALIIFAYSSGVFCAGDSDGIHSKEYFMTVLNAHIRNDELRFLLMDKALQKQEEDIKEKFIKTNELRGEVITDRAEYLRISSFETFERDFLIWKTAVDSNLTETKTYYSIGAFLVVIANIGVTLWLRKKTPYEMSRGPNK